VDGESRAEARQLARERHIRHRQAVVRRRRAVAGLVGTLLVAVSVYGLVDLAIGGGSGGSAAGGSGSTQGSSAAACTALKLHGGVVVTRLRTADGSCAGVHQAAYYTCPTSPGVPTVTATVGGSQHRYLGGPLAASVAGEPPRLQLLGASRRLKVYYRPATGAVYVSNHGSWSRWLTAPSAAPSQPSVYFLGDSVMLGAQPWVKGDLGDRWAVTFDARVDRSTPQGLAIAEAHGGHLGDAAVIQLGTNDGGRPAYYIGQVDRVLQKLRGMPLVVWLTIAHARSYYATDDRLLRTAIARYPNAVVADWAGTVKPGDVYADGLHLTPAGGKAMSRLSATTLNRWRQAAIGSAAQACASQVAAAA